MRHLVLIVHISGFYCCQQSPLLAIEGSANGEMHEGQDEARSWRATCYPSTGSSYDIVLLDMGTFALRSRYVTFEWASSRHRGARKLWAKGAVLVLKAILYVAQ